MKKFLWLGSLAFALGWFMIPRPTQAVETRDIVFPVIGSVSYYNDWHAPRSGHLHEGNDLMGRKMQPLVATVDGTVRFAPYPQPSYGWIVSIEDEDGYEYWYLHINNDTPGTDNGLGGPTFAYALGMRSGWPVKAGQLIGYMGDSGNAEGTRAHLHFEIHRPNGDTINPFDSLQAARRIGSPVPADLRPGEIRPFGAFTGGVRMAAGDLDPAREGEELVMAAGPGGGPHIRVYDAGHALLSEFFVPLPTFRGGLDVAVGDVNVDGTDEIIVGLGKGAEPRVYVFQMDGTLISQFTAYIPLFRGGINVAAADLDGNGTDEIITGPGRGGGPDVRVHNYAGELLKSFYAYDPKFRGGVDVTGVNAEVFGAGRIITAAGPGGGPDVRVFDYPNGELIFNYFSFYREFRGGLRVDIWENPDDAEQPVIVTIPAEGLQSFVHRHTFSGEMLEERLVFENWWFGGFDVMVANDAVYGATGRGRPASVQQITYSSFFDFDDGD